MAEALGFTVGLGIGLIVGFIIALVYLKLKIARLTANAQAVAIDFAAGKIKEISKDAVKRHLAKKGSNGAQ